MTPAALKSYSHKDLAQMAKQGGVRGWHSMRKEQLVKALLTASKAKPTSKAGAPPRRSTPAKAVSRAPSPAARKVVTNGRAQQHISNVKAKLQRLKNLSTEKTSSKGPTKERIVVMVRDPFWLHAYWEVRRQSVE